MQVGLFFGSFNPIHNGHLILAQTALNETALDAIWFVVSPQNPFKQKKNLLPAYDRLKMVELALGDHPSMMGSNVEFSLPKPSYTIDTLTHLRERYQSYSFALIMGQDNLQHFHKWKNHEAILKYYPIYVYPRPGADSGMFEAQEAVSLFEAPLLDISATYIRQTVRQEKSIRFLTPEPVVEYIQRNRLFT